MCSVDKHSRPDHDADLCVAGAAINDFDGSRKDIPIAAYYWDDYNYCILILWCPGIEWNKDRFVVVTVCESHTQLFIIYYYLYYLLANHLMGHSIRITFRSIVVT